MKLINKFVCKFSKALSFPYEYYMLKNKCIFIHIPKTAGTSILYNLGKISKGGRQHLPWYVYRWSNPYRYEKYFKFCFVRNPWDKVYSAYCYLISGGNQQGDMIASKSISFFNSYENFVLDGLGKGHFRNHYLFLPQSNFILGPNEDIMVDFLGRYENLEKDFKIIAEKLGIDSKIPTMNKSPNLNTYKWWQAYSSKKSIEIIEDIYKQDVRVFGYNF